MKIAILNDTHAGIRNASDIFTDNANVFYNEFFSYLKKKDIKKGIKEIGSRGRRWIIEL